MTSKMTSDQIKELISLEKDDPSAEEYRKRLNDFYDKHNFRSPTIADKWKEESETY